MNHGKELEILSGYFYWISSKIILGQFSNQKRVIYKYKYKLFVAHIICLSKLFCSKFNPFHHDGCILYSFSYAFMQRPSSILYTNTFTHIFFSLGIYAKTPIVSQYASANLKNLCALDPSIGHIIMPFLLKALGERKEGVDVRLCLLNFIYIELVAITL